MLNRKRKRIRLIFFGLLLLAAAAILVGYALKDTIEFFKSPSELIADPPAFGKRFRLGGLVGLNSVVLLEDGSVSFEVTDEFSSIEVRFAGILPDLFSENQGVIAIGFLKNKSIFLADEVLAKHDENYMPKELIENLKDKGVYVDPVKE